MKKHVLLVAQETEELKNFVEALNETGLEYKCTWSQTGAQALSQLQYLQPDYIFISAQLAQSDTLELISAIHNAHSSQTHCMVFTRDDDPAFEKEVIALGAATIEFTTMHDELSARIQARLDDIEAVPN